MKFSWNQCRICGVQGAGANCGASCKRQGEEPQVEQVLPGALGRGCGPICMPTLLVPSGSRISSCLHLGSHDEKRTIFFFSCGARVGTTGLPDRPSTTKLLKWFLFSFPLQCLLESRSSQMLNKPSSTEPHPCHLGTKYKGEGS